MGDKYYFSRIQLFDSDEIVMPSLKRKIDRKKKKKLDKLEQNGILIGKDATKLLRKAKLLELKNDEDSSQTLRRKWSIAMLRAQGVKVKDDISLLKKSANKVRKIKAKRRDKWRERKEQVQQKQEDRQARREANIQQRKKQRLAKKLRKAKHRGRVFNLD
ncbi:hypothetical protein FGIG_09968 [Fasciola gigantica]|uniref:Ribosomal RNA-processing protein 14/surfeit locus protein 6 C-terminal domain-containing protein n=1 Tax=Fasciola gigantica TaxID=46835 RepID=A0A504Z6P2_FASGI|nr:hypothetical protein FGIG_09968 [Fasciola gigantica]